MGPSTSPLRVARLRDGEMPSIRPGTYWPAGSSPPGPGSFGTLRLVARRASGAAGWLRAERVQADLYLVAEVLLAEGEDAAAVGAALTGGMARELVGERVRLLTDDLACDAPLRAWLTAGGWTEAVRKVVVDRRAPFPTDVQQPLRGLALRSLDELGEAAFAGILDEAAQGDPFEHPGPRDTADEVRDLIRLAGPHYDPEAWVAAFRGPQAVGVVLPQVEPEGHGTLYYVGVCPPFRRRGLGRALHALGLARLGACGVRRYIGSTDVRNHAMVRIFAQNGCREIAQQVFYEATHAS